MREGAQSILVQVSLTERTTIRTGRKLGQSDPVVPHGSGLLKGLFALKWWQLLIVFAGIMLLISGPAMVMAWLKLRRRNIAPILNANGWAVNAASKISIPFGETLTDVAKFPKMKLKDPYKKGMAGWKKLLTWRLP